MNTLVARRLNQESGRENYIWSDLLTGKGPFYQEPAVLFPAPARISLCKGF